MSTAEPTANADAPWREAPPEGRLCPGSQSFRALVQDHVGDAVHIVSRPDAGPREAILVECLESAAAVHTALRLYPSHVVVGVLAREDRARRLEILVAGADGVITLEDPPDLWRQCLRRVLGGGRWVGEPGLEQQLERKYARYG